MKKRVIAYSFLGMLFLFTLFFVTQQEYIKDKAVDYVTRQLTIYSGHKIELENVQLSLPLNLHMDKVTVRSSDRPVIVIENLDISLTPWKLWQQGLVIDSITMESTAFLDRSKSSKTDSSLTWEAIPSDFIIKKLEIKQLSIAPELLASMPIEVQQLPQPLYLLGNSTLDPKAQEGWVEVSLAHSIHPNEQTHLALGINQKNDQMQLQVRLTESHSGILASQYEFPEGYQLHAFAQATGTVETWQGILKHQVLSDTGIAGEFQVGYEATDSLSVKDILLSSEGYLEGPFTFSHNGFHLPNLSGNIGPLLIQGTINVASQGDFKGTHLQLKTQDSNLLKFVGINASDLVAECFIFGKIDVPMVTWNMQSKSIDVAGFTINDIFAEGFTKFTNDLVDGTISINCKQGLQNFSISTEYAWTEVLRLINFQASSGTNFLNGDLQLDLAKHLLVGDLSGNTELSLFSKLIQHDASGALSFHVHLDQKESEQTIQLLVQSPSIAVDNFQAQQAELKATIVNPFKVPKGLISFSCTQGRYENLEGKDLFFETNLDRNLSEFPFSLSGNTEFGSQLRSKGIWYASSNELFLIIQELTGNAGKYAYASHDPISLFWNIGSKRQLQLSPILLSIGEGSILSTCDFTDNKIHMSMQARHIPLDILRLFNPNIPLDGTASVEAELTQTDRQTIGNLQIQINDIFVHSNSLGLTIPLQLNMQANLKEEGISCSGNISSSGLQHPISLWANMPITMSLAPYALNIEQAKPIQAHFSLDGDLDPILELFIPATGPSITGYAKTVIDIVGTLNDPQISGQIDLENGSFDIAEIGLEFRQIQAHIDFDGRQAILKSLSGTDGKHGTVKGHGQIDLDMNQSYPFDVFLYIDHSLLRPSDYAQATANGQLHLFGNSKSATLQGKIVSDELHIIIPQQIPELTQSVDVTYINQPAELEVPTIFVQKESDWPLALDLQLQIPGNGVISGHDWTSEWKGDVAMTGTTDAPLLRGDVHVVNGEYRFNGKAFDIKEGTITFSGDLEKKTVLYVVASKDIDTVTTEIVLKGPLRDPAITFQSNPPMSQREILAWILFGRGISDITPFQGTQLNESITHLNTTGNGDVLSRIRDRIGIDKIDISRSKDVSSNDVSVQVGKYISRGILVSINKGITAEANHLSVEASVIENVKLEAQVGDDSQGQLLLKWKKDY